MKVMNNNNSNSNSNNSENKWDTSRRFEDNNLNKKYETSNNSKKVLKKDYNNNNNNNSINNNSSSSSDKKLSLILGISSSEVDTMLSILPKQKKQEFSELLRQSISTRMTHVQESHKKTVNELSKEIASLTGILEETEQNKAANNIDNINTDVDDSNNTNNRVIEDNKVNNELNSFNLKQLRINNKNKIKNDTLNQYNFTQLVLSFFFGVILMILSSSSVIFTLLKFQK
jgi:hypothetical protein